MKEEGSSLIEILIALLILAVAGTILVGGLFMARVVSNNSTLKRQAMEQLAEITNQLNSVPFIPCSTDKDSVYPTPAPTSFPQLNDVTLKVEVLDSTSGSWVTCSQDPQSPTHGVQKITVTTWLDRTKNKHYDQVLVKTRG